VMPRNSTYVPVGAANASSSNPGLNPVLEAYGPEFGSVPIFFWSTTPFLLNSLDIGSGNTSHSFTVTGYLNDVAVWSVTEHTAPGPCVGATGACVATLTFDSGIPNYGLVTGIALTGFTGNGYFVDNINFSPVNNAPLPAALPLFAAGLGALGLLGRAGS
jgi:hypothetical protein